MVSIDVKQSVVQDIGNIRIWFQPNAPAPEHFSLHQIGPPVELQMRPRNGRRLGIGAPLLESRHAHPRHRRPRSSTNTPRWPPQSDARIVTVIIHALVQLRVPLHSMSRQETDEEDAVGRQISHSFETGGEGAATAGIFEREYICTGDSPCPLDKV